MSSLKDYPAGRGAVQARYIKDVFVEFGVTKTIRRRYTLAQVNAGQVLLSALPGVRWGLIGARFIATGGGAATATSVNLQGTVAGSTVQLWVVTVAALTRSTAVTMGHTPAAGSETILADGASFNAMDVNTSINLAVVGSALATSTGFDLFISFMAYPG